MGELSQLEAIAKCSSYSEGVMERSIAHCFRVIQRFLRAESVLELGPAEGVMTDLLANLDYRLTVVEGAGKYCQAIRARHPHIKVVHSLFEEFEPREKFDNVVLGHVLEHVVDPVALLHRSKAWLNPNGIIFAAVPNAHSLHRRAAVLMGLLSSDNSLNSGDIEHGHRRVFDPNSFAACFEDAGLTIVERGGYWLKPISNAQIEASWTPEMVDAFMLLGERFPDIAGEIYIVANNALARASG